MSFLQAALSKREHEGTLRSLGLPDHAIQYTAYDFCSNDYLGFARSVHDIGANQDLPTFQRGAEGSTGSRLLSGNSRALERLENYLASTLRAETALVFNSGYSANLGFFQAVANPKDSILFDVEVHASCKDGAKLSRAALYYFRHQDLQHCEERLRRLHAQRKAGTQIFVGVESLYSMDGSQTCLQELAPLCARFDALLVVDEAHAIGTLGKQGEGLVASLGLEQEVFARVVTFGKALGTHGACVLGSSLLKQYLINFSRAFIYTTAMPPAQVASVERACARLFSEAGTNAVAALQERMQLCRDMLGMGKGDVSPIWGIFFKDLKALQGIASALQGLGYGILPIYSPTVPRGRERLRLCVHTFNPLPVLKELLHQIQRVR